MGRLKILVPVDGSPHAERAAAKVIDMVRGGADLELHLLNVQLPLDGHAQSFVDRDALDAYRREEGGAALAGAKQLLDAAGLAYQCHIAVGHTAATIVRFAQEKGFDQIVMGSHGHGKLFGSLFGSVAQEVGKHASVPVTFVS